jgi:hypothetical protein
LTIVTLRFQILYCFVIVDLARREIVHIAVTSSPSAQFTGQSFVEAVVDRNNENPRFMTAAARGRHMARDSCVPSLLSRVRAQDPGAPWPHGGADQPSLQPILGDHPVNHDESWRRFDLVPNFCGGQP